MSKLPSARGSVQEISNESSVPTPLQSAQDVQLKGNLFLNLYMQWRS